LVKDGVNWLSSTASTRRSEHQGRRDPPSWRTWLLAVFVGLIVIGDDLLVPRQQEMVDATLNLREEAFYECDDRSQGNDVSGKQKA
jgi:hypothetical protein